MKNVIILLGLLVIPFLIPNAHATLQFDYSNQTITHDYNTMTLDEFFGPHNLHVSDSFAIVITDSNEHAVKVINTTNLVDPNGGMITYSYNDRVFHLNAADVPTMSFPYIGKYNVTDLNDPSKFGIFNVVDKSVNLSSLALPLMPIIEQPVINNTIQFIPSNETNIATPIEQTVTTNDNSTQITPPTNDNSTVIQPLTNNTSQSTEKSPPPTTTNSQPVILPNIIISQSNLAKADSLRASLGWPPLESIMNVSLS